MSIRIVKIAKLRGSLSKFYLFILIANDAEEAMAQSDQVKCPLRKIVSSDLIIAPTQIGHDLAHERLSVRGACGWAFLLASGARTPAPPLSTGSSAWGRGGRGLLLRHDSLGTA